MYIYIYIYIYICIYIYIYIYILHTHIKSSKFVNFSENAALSVEISSNFLDISTNVAI